ncbi:Na+/H+-exchanging protein [Geothrix limicola]|uniref:Na+/H+-exchanging protein n=1 Tax=Geothrix limicola TaxID=2927978 RepID=A0ABQ5QGA9_9BACT|nr:cation:proton antiporter [Geothrix limicola]GLH73692.1 Na+/H+-exchanging protein [Geothrix limicola]
MPFAFLMHDPLAGTLMLLAVLWLSAKVGGELAVRLKLPAVTGELAVGLALTALHRAWPLFPDVAASPATELLGGLGVVVLMFAVGLESTVPQMLKVGVASLRVALIGVVAPMLAGLAGAWILLPKGSPLVLDLFIGACLCATSIGISAQVLREKGASDSLAGRIIVGAAVVDDVLGLLVLVAVSGMVGAAAGGALGPQLVKTMGLALGFLAAALTLGRLATPRLFQLATRFRGEQVLLPLGLGFAFLLAWLGNLAGLASIVGAYAAGLILEPAHIVDLEHRERHTLEELIHPLVTVLSPLFFVLMGAKVDPGALFKPATLGFALLLALLGVIGKYVAGYGAGRGIRAAVVGWGMVPRGEVGLIFVAAGAQLHLDGVPLLSPDVQAGIIGALLLTTVAGPVGLGWVLRKEKR